MNSSKTFGELKRSGWKHSDVKNEMRRNLIAKLRGREVLFPGIIGYDKTVVPQIVAAILARHDFLLLGLRGQAKTRIIRQLTTLLDEWMPAIEGSPLMESPMVPITRRSRELLEREGDNTPIEWIHRSRRYQEKLATPDVSIADLIGDIDPIKAVSRKLDFSDEEVIHYGIIPRTNRGIFAINELPDLQARIQVGLLNILEEKDIQIRGFPIRLPLDVALVFTANPEDYTNRGNIITPLKDRIDAQILTHYPATADEGIRITAQEAWTDRGLEVFVTPLMHALVEQIAIEARASDFVDKASGVSARMAISFLETLHSVAEMRAHRDQEKVAFARISDLFQSLTALTGKIELVYKGEQEGVSNVAMHLIGKAVKEQFNRRFLNAPRKGRDKKIDFSAFKAIIDWFENGNVLDIDTNMSDRDFSATLHGVEGLESVVKTLANPSSENEKLLLMEFFIEGLHQNFLLTKRIEDARIKYTDAVSYMMNEVGE
ncbi:magnesium chelatase [Candidatus Sumerlaeota bacterium]|nr:magnesium chelatase [Candidatus Sumerlaeota bacterium]